MRRSPLLSSPPPVEEAAAEALRGELFGDLDRLAFALEMEAAERIAAGDEPGGARLQELRLGVRLAQRLVAAVHADEVHARLQRWNEAYEARLRPGDATRRERSGEAEDVGQPLESREPRGSRASAA